MECDPEGQVSTAFEKTTASSGDRCPAHFLTHQVQNGTDSELIQKKKDSITRKNVIITENRKSLIIQFVR